MVGDRMKYFLKIIGVAIALWVLSLFWLELNVIFFWPLFMGAVVGVIPAYWLGRYLSRRHLFDPTRPILPILGSDTQATQPTPPWRRPNLAADPTRPTRIRSAYERASSPTRPMPAL